MAKKPGLGGGAPSRAFFLFTFPWQPFRYMALVCVCVLYPDNLVLYIRIFLCWEHIHHNMCSWISQFGRYPHLYGKLCNNINQRLSNETEEWNVSSLCLWAVGICACLIIFVGRFCIQVALQGRNTYYQRKSEYPPLGVCNETDHTYLKQPEPDQFAAWASRGAGLFTDEILQTVRDPTSLGAQR